MKNAAVVVAYLAACVVVAKVVIGNSYGVSPWKVQIFPTPGSEGFVKPTRNQATGPII